MTSSSPPLAPPNRSLPRAHAANNSADSKSRLAVYGFILLIVMGVLLRLLIVVFAGNRINAPWGGTGDAPAYFLLAQNVASGKGYAYAGHPTAYRPPAYVLLLAGLIKFFPDHSLAAMRGLQFLMGLSVAVLCARVAGRFWGGSGERTTLLIALFFPTLVIMTGEILTEATATLMSAAFLYLLVRFWEEPRWFHLVAVAIVIGMAALVRFNMALFGFVALAAIFLRKGGLPKWSAAIVTTALSLLVVSPWMIRNLVVFHGSSSALLTTQSGNDVVTGLLAPQGRALPGDAERIRAAVGWVIPQELETNDPSRNLMPEEPALNRQAWTAGLRLWRAAGWRLIPITAGKVSYFWLSTDQLFWTATFRPWVRAARAAGVVVYWMLLILAMAGWYRLRIRDPKMATLLLFYAVLVTILHMPFNMNTRYRMPFMDPLIAVLAGGAALHWGSRIAGRARLDPTEQSQLPFVVERAS